MIYNKFTVILTAAVALMMAGVPVQAHKGATGVVMQRMMAMKDMGDIMKSWAAIRRGKAAYKPAQVRAQAMVLQRHAGELPKLFPKGSIKGPSEALPAIWQKWDAFAASALALQKLAEKLESEAGWAKETAVPVMVEIGGTCSGCHKDFRQKKKK